MHTNSPTNSQTRRQQTPQAPQRPGGPSQPSPHPSPTTSQQPRSYSPEPLSRYGLTSPQPQPGIPAAAPRNTKLDQIIQNFYTKVAQVVIQARLTHHDGQPLILPQATTSTGSTASTRSVASNLGASRSGGTGGKKTNKWFNLEMDDLDLFKDELKFWRNMATTVVPSSATHPGTTPLPMIIELYLDTSELTQSQILIVTDETMRRNRVDLAGSGSGTSFGGGRYGGGNGGNGGHVQKSILLESWELTLNQPTPDPPPDLPVVYKKSIIFFRSLYAYVRLLPAFRLQRRLRKMKGLASLRLGYRLVTKPTVRNDEIPINVPVDSDSRPATSDYRFGSIDTPLGVLSLLVVYRRNCDFNADDSERDLSSQFIDMDENYFKPTMVEYRKELDSIERARKRTSLDERRLGLEGIGGIGGERMVRGPSRGSKQSFTESLASQTFSAGSGILGTPPSGQTSAGLSAIYGQGTRPEATESTPIFSARNEEDSRGLLSQRTQRRVSLRSRGSSGSLSGSPPKASITSTQRVFGGRGLTADTTSVGLEDTGTPQTMSSSPSSVMGPAAASSTFRRPSIGIISPFKSPSFSSSPTQQELIPTPSTSGQRTSSSSSTLLQKSTSYSSLGHRSHERTPSVSSPIIPRAPVPSSSTGRSTSQQPVPQFSSSFDRYRSGSSERSSPTRDNLMGPTLLARKPSKASVTSLNKLSDDGSDSSWFTSQTDDDEVNNFVKMVDSHQNLNIFSKRPSTASRMTGSAMSGGGMSDSANSMAGSGLSPKLALSHFQALRETHNNLSESMTPDALFLQSAESGVITTSPTDRQATIATSTSPGSSSTLSLQGRAHQPAIPSPLSAQTVPLPMHILQELPLPHSPAYLNQLQPRSRQDEPKDIDNEGASRGSMPDDLFESTSVRPAHSDNHPLLHPTQEATGTYSASTSTAALSSSRVIRQYPSSGGNSISSLNSARGGSQMARHGSGGSMNENLSSVLGSAAANSTGARGGSVEDDDSLLFTMSELSAEASSNPPSAGPFGTGTSSILGGAFALPAGTRVTSSTGGAAQVYGDYSTRGTAISSGGPFAIGTGVNPGSVAGAGFVPPFSRETGTGEDMARRASAQGVGMDTLVEEEERSTESGRSSAVASRSDSMSSSDSLRKSGAAPGRVFGR